MNQGKRDKYEYIINLLDALGIGCFRITEVKLKGNIYPLALGIPLFKSCYMGVNSSICLDGMYVNIKSCSSSHTTFSKKFQNQK